MNEHHNHASIGVARVLLDGLAPAEQAQVQAEADAEGVSAVEIVRRSLDILIAESPAAGRGGKTAGQGGKTAGPAGA